MRKVTATFAVLLGGATPWGAVADLYQFDEVQAPVAFTMHSNYYFYVYSAADAPDRSYGEPTVTTKLSLMSDNHSPQPARLTEVVGYKSVEMSLLPLADLDKLVDQSAFCARRDGVSSFSPRPQTPGSAIITHRVSGEMREAFIDRINKTGMYVLITTNCGNLTGFRLTGSVSVQNPHGYLRAPDYNKQTLYASLAVFYMAALLIWAALVARWRAQVIIVQKDLLWISLTGVGECVAMYMFYYSLNKTDEVSDLYFIAGSLLSLLKICMSFRVVLLLSQLLCEEVRGTHTIDFALVTYGCADFNVRMVGRIRAGYGLDSKVLLINAAPEAFMGVVLFVWCFIALRQGKGMCEKQQAQLQASLITKSSVIVAFATVGALAAFIAHLSDSSISVQAPNWGMHFVYSDCISHVVFALLLVSAMLVWMPSCEMQGYKYAGQQQDPECQPIGAVVDEDAQDTSDKPAE